jgi:acetolactate synthase-1/2/3 large subunit
MKMKGARIVVESLLKENVDTIFAYIGGQIITVFDELYHYRDRINIIQPRHEQGGTHAADGYARSTGKPGVVIVTSGPGATNTVTGIATAYMDSIPLIIITGQVPTHFIGTDAFQEADITGITMPITKANFLVKDVDDLAMTIKRAFYVACTGRPGPVLIDIPSDVQKKETEFHYPETIMLKSYNPVEHGHPRQIKAALEMLKTSEKPLVLVGGGVNFSDTTDLVNEFIDTFKIPAVTTMMGHGLNPKNEDLYIGTIGMHGTLYGNHALQNADLIFALGTRFSDRIMGEAKTFAPKARIVHIDVDPAEIGKNKDIHVPIVGTVRSVISQFLKQGAIDRCHEEWIKELKEFKKKHPLTYGKTGGLKPQHLIQLANRYFPEDTIVASDVGQNQMWVSQYYRFRQPRCYLSSGGLGTMGFALPAAIGAKLGNPKRSVLMVAGDGGFQMNIQELATIKHYDLAVKMLVLDNSCLGMVRQWQELLFEKRYSQTTLADNPDFAEIVRAYGIHAITIDKPEQAEKAIKELVKAKGPMLVYARIDPCENVLPMVPAGQSLDNAITKI